MMKNIAALEIKIGERLYKFICDVDCPLGEVHDCLAQMKNYIVQRINDAHKQEVPSKDEAPACCQAE